MLRLRFHQHLILLRLHIRRSCRPKPWKYLLISIHRSSSLFSSAVSKYYAFDQDVVGWEGGVIGVHADISLEDFDPAAGYEIAVDVS